MAGSPSRRPLNDRLGVAAALPRTRGRVSPSRSLCELLLSTRSEFGRPDLAEPPPWSAPRGRLRTEARTRQRRAKPDPWMRQRPSPAWAETPPAAPSRGQQRRAIGRDPTEGKVPPKTYEWSLTAGDRITEGIVTAWPRAAEVRGAVAHLPRATASRARPVRARPIFDQSRSSEDAAKIAVSSATGSGGLA